MNLLRKSRSTDSRHMGEPQYCSMFCVSSGHAGKNLQESGVVTKSARKLACVQVADGDIDALGHVMRTLREALLGASGCSGYSSVSL